MAKKNPVVQQRRQEVMKRHGNVMRKLRRLEKVNGAKVAGTEFDPTRDPSKVKNYNMKQLASYEAQLSAFLSRKVQYVGDSHGRPMVKQVWDRYVKLKTSNTAQAVAELEANADLYMPFAGQTIGDRARAMTPDRPHMHNPSVTNPREAKDLKPSRVASQKALETLLDDAKSKASPDYLQKRTQHRRENFDAIARDAPDDVRERTKNLTDHQFNILWAFTDFVEELSTHYEQLQQISEGKKPADDRGALRVLRTSESLLGEMLDWAESLK